MGLRPPRRPPGSPRRRSRGSKMGKRMGVGRGRRGLSGTPARETKHSRGLSGAPGRLKGYAHGNTRLGQSFNSQRGAGRSWRGIIICFITCNLCKVVLYYYYEKEQNFQANHPLGCRRAPRVRRRQASPCPNHSGQAF